ncbi:MAG TPA: glycoside hydrolase family 127 protein [Panacibacter sp.]|nr:glycoside hydrolase family 127 protein [Panacibacter sp.]
MKKCGLVRLCCLLLFAGTESMAQSSFPSIEPVSFSKVQIDDHFWKPRIEKVALVTIPVCIDQTAVKTPRLRNFEKVARHKGEKHEGIFYDDSDVYKALEAIAYALNDHPDAALEKKADEWIDIIAAAQLPDGYLNTYFTLGDLSQRWTDMSMHEDYNGGHLIEAAVAYYQATGKRKLLDVAIRFADHFDSLFGPSKRHWVTGHEELELALVKLYKTTKNEKYLNLSHWLLEERGHGYAKGYTWTDWKDTAYAQDKTPVKETKEITGHAVRAMYLYTGAADVAAATNDTGYMHAMKNVWEDVVYRNMYITGGIGSSGNNEGFSVDYDLPNDHAYCETCASVGMVFWNQRMNLLTGESKYMDVLERSLYNGTLDGLSLSGDRFFYGNPLASNGNYERREWFGTACCPANIARLIASLGNYIYATSNDAIWVNLFVGSNTTIPLAKGNMYVQQQTNYPWDGSIKINVSPEKKMKYKLMVRIPGWAQNQPVPGNTYQYLQAGDQHFTITVNGQPAEYTMQNGYAVIDREWKKGDELNLNLPMDIKRITATENVKDDRNRVALERGPLVYCIEHTDNNGSAMNIILPDNASLSSAYNAALLNGVVTITGEATVIKPTTDGSGIETVKQNITAIPYYAWANRGEGQMQIWIPRKAAGIKIETN